jgi:hypothetical protein
MRASLVSSVTDFSIWSMAVFSRLNSDMMRRLIRGVSERRDEKKGSEYLVSGDSRLEVQDVEKNDRDCDTMRDSRVTYDAIYQQTHNMSAMMKIVLRPPRHIVSAKDITTKVAHTPCSLSCSQGCAVVRQSSVRAWQGNV